MKLNYTDGCTCTSLTVDDKETIDISMDDFKCILNKMINYVWNNPKECIYNILKYLLEEQGEHYNLKYGENDIFDEIDVYRYDVNDRFYLTYILGPLDEKFIVNELVDSCCKIVRHTKWDNKQHCNELFLNAMKGMIDKLEDFADLQQIFCIILEKYGEADDPVHCSCCGDIIYSYTLNI